MTTTHDFGDGPVLAHQHVNGGGWVADSADVAERAYVGRDAEVAGGTIWGGIIRGGIIWGGIIRGGTIWGGTIRGGDIWGGDIRGGIIWGGTIWGGTIWGGTIWGGDIWGGDIWGGIIRGGTIRGGIIRGGDIWGGTIWGGTIRGGIIRGGDIWGGIIRGGDIRGTRDVLVCGPVGSEDQLVTLVRDGAEHVLSVGCWHGHHVDELAAEVAERAPQHTDEYQAVEALLRVRLAEWGQS